MTFHTHTALLIIACAGTLGLPAAAEEVAFMAELSGGAQVPPVDTEAMGMSDMTLDTEAMTVSWMITYLGLSGDPLAAHFHGPASPEETAPPVIDITESLMEGAEENMMEGSAALTEAQMADLQAGLYYINIHTEQNPDGEIRGQVLEGEADTEVEAAMEGEAVMDGEVIRAALAGNTVQGSMLDSGAYSEFYAADGTIKGEGYTGTWSIEGDAMCFAYSEEEATCWQARLAGDQVTWVRDGADVGDGTIVPGNPNSF